MDRRILGNLKVFLSHSSADESEVVRYADLLKASGFSATWTFEKDMMAGGDAIADELTTHIEQCDFLFLFVSDASLRSPYVQLELGLALALQKERRSIDREKWNGFNPEDAAKLKESGGPHPTDNLLARPAIIPVWVRDSGWRASNRRPTQILTRTVLEGEPTGAYSLSGKGHDPLASADTDEALIRQITPRLHFFGLPSTNDPLALDSEAMEATGVFELYETLFPEIERDGRLDIIKWVFERDDGSVRPHTIEGAVPRFLRRPAPLDFEYQLHSWYPTLTIRGKAVAFAFLTYHPRSKLMYGNYVAVQEAWRPGAIADIFWRTLQQQVVASFPECRGLIFEVETIDVADVERIIKGLERQQEPRGFREKLGASDLPDEVVIRRFLRLVWYDRRSALIFKDRGGRPVVSTSPCLDPNLPRAAWEEEEESYWLAWFPAPNQRSAPAPTWEEAAMFAIIEVLAKSLVMEYPEHAPEYWNYANTVAKRVVGLAPGRRSRVSRLLPTKRMNRLFQRWRALDIPLAI